MNISSLSIQNKKRLSELLEDLTDILKRKDSLIESASLEIDRMNIINDMQNKLDAKGSEFTNIKTPMDAKELQELVEKSDKLSSEKEEINFKSKQLNNDLQELVNIENSLMDEINKILSTSSLNDDKDNALFVEQLNSNIYIIDAQIPENKDIISQEFCEIINCNINLISEIAKLYNSNINKIVIDATDNDFDELKQTVQQYKTDKNNSYDKQLEILKKSFEKNEIKDEPVLEKLEEVSDENVVLPMPELPSEEIPKVSSVTEEKPVIENKPDENIVPLTSLLDQQLMDSKIEQKPENNNTVIDSLENEIPKEKTSNLIYFNSNDKVVPNQIARATKEKLNNKIINIFDGSFPETKIEIINTSNELNPSFNIDSFVTNKAA